MSEESIVGGDEELSRSSGTISSWFGDVWGWLRPRLKQIWSDQSFRCLCWLLVPVFILREIEYYYDGCGFGLDHSMRAFQFDMALAVPVLLLGFLGRFYAVSLWILTGLLCICQVSTLLMFHTPLGADFFDVVNHTSIAEIKEFSGVFSSPLIIILLCAVLGFTITVAYFICRCRTSFKAWHLVLAVLLLLPSSINLLRWHFIFNDPPSRMFAKNLLTNLAFQYSFFANERKEMNQAIFNPAMPPGIRLDTCRKPEKFWGVVIIGESGSRNHMSLYGYHRETNPLLKAIRDELYVFNDVVSVAAQTGPALRACLILGRHNNDKYTASIANLCKTCGYQPSFVSNSPPLGKWNAPVSMAFSCAAYKQHTVKNDMALPLDQEVLNHFDKILGLYPDSFNAVFLQIIDSHADYRLRYPAEFARFDGLRDASNNHLDNIKAERVNQYDNSRLYNDFIVTSVIERVRATGAPGFVMYFSDHGEALYEDGENVFHQSNVPCRYMYEIPCVVWLSPELKRRDPGLADRLKASVNHPIQANRLIFGFMSLFGITSDPIFDTVNPFSPAFVPVKRMIANKDYERVRAKDMERIRNEK